MDFKTLWKCVERITECKKRDGNGDCTADPVMIRGNHGIGKSEFVKQFAEFKGLEIIEKRVIHFAAGDFSGIPKTDGEWTVWCPPDFLVKACRKPVLLFLDEVDRGHKDVRQAVMQLGDSRQLNGWKLHPQTLIFSAMNGGPENTHYQVYDMDLAEVSRWWVADYSPTVEDWLLWASKNCKHVVCDFIKNSSMYLEHQGEPQSGTIVPCRRSWKRLSDKLCSDDFKKENLDFVYPLSVGYVGYEAASAFHKYVQNYQFVITPEDILNGERLEECKNLTMLEHSEIIERFVNRQIFHNELSSEQMRNLGNYCEILPSAELTILVFQIMQPAVDSNNEKFNVRNFMMLEHSKTKVGYAVWIATMMNGDEDIVDKASKKLKEFEEKKNLQNEQSSEVESSEEVPKVESI